MSLQVIVQRPYTFLPSGILIVEPHEGLLAARSMLLAAADTYAGFSGIVRKLGIVEKPGTDKASEVAVAILSESLGRVVLSATAQVIRKHWPRARILIFGRLHPAIEDNLYDARIDHLARPEDLLAALLALSEDPWNQRARPVASAANGAAAYLYAASSMRQLAESDPAKRSLDGVKQNASRDLPGAEQQLRQVSS